jgi:hypothetical protein
MARVYFVSPDTPCWNWGLFGTTIFVDSKRIVSLQENTYSQIDLRPGAYTLSTSTDHQRACNDGAPSNWSPLRLDIKEGETRFIKYGAARQIRRYCEGTCRRSLIDIDQTTAEEQMYGTEYVPAKQLP